MKDIGEVLLRYLNDMIYILQGWRCDPGREDTEVVKVV